MIKLAQALALMDQGEIFSCKFVTYNQQKKTGGEIIAIAQARLHQRKPEAAAMPAVPAPAPVVKSPNHWANSTRNLFILESEQIRKFHIRLLIEFNGQKVIY